MAEPRKYLENFEGEIRIKSIPGKIEKVGPVLKARQFDRVVSIAVMGQPTKDLN